MKYLIPLAFLILTGCFGRGVRPAYTRNGVTVYEAKCNGMARTINDCYEQASKLCGGNFKEVGTDATSSFVGSANGYVPVNNRSLAFTCD